MTFDNVHLNVGTWFPRRQGSVYPPHIHDYRPGPKGKSMFQCGEGDGPCDGVYFEHVYGARVTRSSVTWFGEDSSWWGRCVGNDNTSRNIQVDDDFACNYEKQPYWLTER